MGSGQKFSEIYTLTPITISLYAELAPLGEQVHGLLNPARFRFRLFCHVDPQDELALLRLAQALEKAACDRLLHQGGGRMRRSDVPDSFQTPCELAAFTRNVYTPGLR